jgi:hypothetical protein
MMAQSSFLLGGNSLYFLKGGIFDGTLILRMFPLDGHYYYCRNLRQKRAAA